MDDFTKMLKETYNDYIIENRTNDPSNFYMILLARNYNEGFYMLGLADEKQNYLMIDFPKFQNDKILCDYSYVTDLDKIDKDFLQFVSCHMFDGLIPNMHKKLDMIKEMTE